MTNNNDLNSPVDQFAPIGTLVVDTYPDFGQKRAEPIFTAQGLELPEGEYALYARLVSEASGEPVKGVAVMGDLMDRAFPASAAPALMSDDIEGRLKRLADKLETGQMYNGIGNENAKLYADAIRALLAAHPFQTAARDVLAYPDELTGELHEVLGWPNFKCSPFAHVMQAAGLDIKRKAEDEQAHVLHWLVKLVLKHGVDWRDEATKDMSAWREAIKDRGAKGGAS